MMKAASLMPSAKRSRIGSSPVLSKSVRTDQVQSCRDIEVMLGKKGMETKPWGKQRSPSLNAWDCLSRKLKMNSNSTTDSVEHVTMRTSMTRIMCGTGELQGGSTMGALDRYCQ